MALPTFGAAGTASSSTGTSTTPGYPAGISAGQLLLLQTDARSGSHANTPAGWAAADVDLNGGIEQAWYSKIADGTESGTLTVTYTGGFAYHTSRIYSINGANSVEGSAVAADNNLNPAPPTVTTLGADRLVVALVDVNGNEALAAFTGMTGGTWAEPVAEATGSDTLQIQTAGIASAGTISGGSITTAAPHAWIVRAFAVYQSSAPTTAPRRSLLGVGA